MNIKDRESNEMLRKIFQEYMMPQKWHLFSLVLLILGGVAIGNLAPYVYGKMIDAINAGDLHKLLKLISLYCVATFFTVLLSLAEQYSGEMLSFKIVNQIKRGLFERVVSAKLKDYSKYTTGEFISRLNSDSDSIVTFFLDLFTNAGQVIVNLVISVVYIVSISLKLSSVALFYLPANFLVSHLARKYYKKLAEKQRALEDKHYSFLNEVLSNYEGIKAFQLEKLIFGNYGSIIAERLRLTKENLHIGNSFNLLNKAISMISFTYIMYTSAVLIHDNILTLGDMVAFNTYINLMYTSVSTIWSFNISRQTVLVSAYRIREMLSMEEEVFGENEKFEIPERENMIAASHVRFKYPLTDVSVLQDVTFSIKENGLYCFVGKNGSGKSTLAKLLMRFYDRDSGEIELFEKAYDEISLNNLRRNIIYVQKEDFFLKDTIFNNLVLAKEDASFQEVKEVCMQADIHSYIMSLPNQYDTVIGEGGSTLSSGQKQKLSIARALLRKSPILILDEVTANLDGKAEKEIMEVLTKVKRNAIILMISHKPSAITYSDYVFVIHEGIIVAEGKHENLLKESDVYQDLFGELVAV